MNITFKTSGSFKKTEKFLAEMQKMNSTVRRVMDAEGQRGVQALIAATPKDSGLAASSWSYQIIQNGRKISLVWTNSNEENGGFPVAVMLQYGYATGTGGYVQGRDYINGAMKPIFDSIADNIWKAVKSA